MEAGAFGRACGTGKHIKSYGRNTSCVQSEFDTNSTLCRKREKINAEKHKTYKAALR